MAKGPKLKIYDALDEVDLTYGNDVVFKTKLIVSYVKLKLGRIILHHNN